MAWLLRIVGGLTAPTSMALSCRWRSRPQHQKRTFTPSASTRIALHSASAGLVPVSSVDQFEVAGLPGLVEPWLKRAVEPQEHEVALAGHGLDPVRFLPLRRLRTEIDRVGAVSVGP